MLEGTLFWAGVEARRRLVEDAAVVFLFLSSVETMVGILLRFRPLPSVGDFSLPVEGSRFAPRPRVTARPLDLAALAFPRFPLPFSPAALFGSVREHLSFAS
jgi:hypothetical protein